MVMVDKNKFVEDYEISTFTMMIQPVFNGDEVYSKISELEDELLLPCKPIDVVKKSCEYYGSSFEGRREGTKRLTQVTHKSPITIDSTNQIYLFPTASPSNDRCIWLSQRHIVSYKAINNRSTIVYFTNQQSEVIPVSYTSLTNQIQRTTFLQVKLTQHLEEAGRKDFHYRRHSANPLTSESELFYNLNKHNNFE